MKTDDKKDDRNRDCPCTWPGCPRHGDCKACKDYHNSAGQRTTCEKLKNNPVGSKC